VYAHCRDASDYVLAIRAYIELFNVIAGSFSSRRIEGRRTKA